MRHLLGLLLFELLLISLQNVRTHFTALLHKSVLLHVFEVGQVVFLGLVPELGISWAAEVETIGLQAGLIRLIVFFIRCRLLFYLLLHYWLRVRSLSYELMGSNDLPTSAADDFQDLY